jgi:hypothetical protein
MLTPLDGAGKATAGRRTSASLTGGAKTHHCGNLGTERFMGEEQGDEQAPALFLWHSLYHFARGAWASPRLATPPDAARAAALQAGRR